MSRWNILIMCAVLALGVTASAAAQLERIAEIAQALDIPATEQFMISPDEVAVRELYNNPSALFSFSLAETALVTIHAESVDVDTVLALFDSDLTELDWNDDWYGGVSDDWESLISRALEPGVYYVVAGGFCSSSEGPVQLQVTAESMELTPDQQLSLPGTLDVLLAADSPQAVAYGGPAERIGFTISEPRVIQLHARSEEVEPLLSLFDERLNQLALNDNWRGEGSSERQSRITVQLEAGSYYAEISAAAPDSYGLVQLQLQELAAIPTGGTELQVPASILLYLDERMPSAGEYMGPGLMFSFNLAERSVIVIHAESDSIDTTLELLDADLRRVDHNDDWLGGNSSNWESRIVRRLEPGTWHVIAGGYWPSSRGTLTLSLDHGDDSMIHNWDSAPTLTVPEQILVQIDEGMPEVGWNFSGAVDLTVRQAGSDQ